MPFQISKGVFERSNAAGANPIYNNESIKKHTSKWIADKYDQNTALKSETQNIYCIPNDGKPLQVVSVFDGSHLRDKDTTRLNDVRFISVVSLKLPADFRPTQITSARQEIEQNAMRYSICLPIAGIHAEGKTTFETLAETVYHTISQDYPEILETYKWLLYRKWDQSLHRAIIFRCPYCQTWAKTAKLEYDADIGTCTACHHEISATDFFIGYRRRLGDRDDIEGIPAIYMNDLERLVLLNEIRLKLQNKENISEYIFVSDGNLRFEDDELGRAVVNLLKYAYDIGQPLNIVSQEKSGRFYNHIKHVETFLSERQVFIPSDDYMQNEILQRGEKKLKGKRKIYGSFHNLGIKVFVKFKDRQTLILNVPAIKSRKRIMQYNDIMKLSDILATIEQFALNGDRIKWIEYAHNAVSMSENEYAALVRHYFGELE
jgi:hypothetical protein